MEDGVRFDPDVSAREGLKSVPNAELKVGRLESMLKEEGRGGGCGGRTRMGEPDAWSKDLMVES